jgi:hypothetical protein
MSENSPVAVELHVVENSPVAVKLFREQVKQMDTNSLQRYIEQIAWRLVIGVLGPEFNDVDALTRMGIYAEELERRKDEQTDDEG